MSEVPGDKLHKVLADQGLGSRREIERWIAAGRVQVDGEPAHVGQRVTGESVIALDGKPLRKALSVYTRVLVMNKAVGTICTRRDPEGRPTVFDDLPKLRTGRWIAVGRLDVQTSGLLLLTNEGELANRLMHPSTMLDREYAVRVDGRLSDEEIQALMAGVEIDGEMCRFSDLQHFNGSGRNHWYHAVLMEGRNHEVRNLFASIGRTVSRLKRVRYGPAVLPSYLRVGRVAEMVDEEVATVCRLVGVRHHKAPQRGKPQKPKRKESLLLPYPELEARTGRAAQ